MNQRPTVAIALSGVMLLAGCGGRASNFGCGGSRRSPGQALVLEQFNRPGVDRGILLRQSCLGRYRSGSRWVPRSER